MASISGTVMNDFHLFSEILARHVDSHSVG